MRKARTATGGAYVPPSARERMERDSKKAMEEIPVRQNKRIREKRKGKKGVREKNKGIMEKSEPSVEVDEMYGFVISDEDINNIKEIEIELETVISEECVSSIMNKDTVIKFKETILPCCILGKVIFKLVCLTSNSIEDVETVVMRYKGILKEILDSSATHKKKFLNETVIMNMYLSNPRLNASWTVLEAIWDCFYRYDIVESDVFIEWVEKGHEMRGRKEAIIALSAWFDWIQKKYTSDGEQEVMEEESDNDKSDSD